MALTEQQLADRLKYVTGSDAAVILGLSPWKGIVQLYQEKTGYIEQEDISDKPWIKAGNYLEPVIRQWFEDETGKRTISGEQASFAMNTGAFSQDDLEQLWANPNMDFQSDQLIISPQYPWMAANVDGLLVDENAGLEIKTAWTSAGWGKGYEHEDNEIPAYYLCQVAHYAITLDVDRFYIAVLIGGSDFRWYMYERNPRFEQILIEKEKEFYNAFTNENSPLPRTSDDVLHYYGALTNTTPKLADAATHMVAEELVRLKQERKEIDDQIGASEETIKIFMSDSESLCGVDGKPLATWKMDKQGRSTVDSQKLKKEKPDIYDQYVKISKPTRRFLLKLKGE